MRTEAQAAQEAILKERRERIATAVYPLALVTFRPTLGVSAEDIAAVAVNWADRLIEALDKA